MIERLGDPVPEWQYSGIKNLFEVNIRGHCVRPKHSMAFEENLRFISFYRRRNDFPELRAAAPVALDL